MESLSPARILTTAWSRPPLDEGFVATTLVLLADVPPAELQRAVEHLARTRPTWRPDAALIRETVVHLRGLFPSIGEAGRSAREYARSRAQRRLGPQRRYPIVHPAVADAVQAAGADHMASFTRAYREVVDERFSAIQADDLRRPVTFTPVSVATDHRPPALTWSARAWWTPAGDLYRIDRGDQFPGRLGTPDSPAAALPPGDTP